MRKRQPYGKNAHQVSLTYFDFAKSISNYRKIYIRTLFKHVIDK
jgi:hypothetical protein